MFVSKVRLAKADKILMERAAEKLEAMRLTLIPYGDEKYWEPQEWVYMLGNKVLNTSEGFYIRSQLFKN